MSSPDRVLIYLADLSHTGLQVATESFPLNIGLVASHAKHCLGQALDIQLFKYPDRLLKTLRERAPDILGCSNYVWNSNLSEWALGCAKQLHPSIVTVQGGTNYPFHADGQLAFLRAHPNTDFHVFYEGEVAFTNLIRRFIEARSPHGMKEEPIAGCQFISPKDGTLVSGPPVERLGSLDEVRSPYVTGLLDEFFDGRLTPMLETTRGCPFTCNFCNAGDQYYNKVKMFSLKYVEEELTYIAPRIASVGVSHLTVADNNFGMYARDAEICRIIKRVQQRYGWPMGLISTTGKNNKDRIIQATEILGSSLLISMSVQSMSRDVLLNIKRQNISLDTYRQINKELVQQGRSGMAEVIFPLPGETYASFMEGIAALIEAGANKIMSYTLQLLYGTPYKDPEYRREHGYQGKWRLIPLDYGEYEGERVFDVEEVAVSSRSVSFDDYLLARGFALVTESLYNNYIFWELLRYLKDYGISPYAWLRAVWDRRAAFPESIQRVFDNFITETQAELFDSEEELRRFYQQDENYHRLLRGEIGGNVLYKHKARLLTTHMSMWVEFVASIAEELMVARTDATPQGMKIGEEIRAVTLYLKRKFSGMLDPDAPADGGTERFQYDIVGWRRDQTGKPLSDFYSTQPVEYAFVFSREQMVERRDSFRRYGTDLHGLAKVLARIPSHERLLRQAQGVAEAGVATVSMTPSEPGDHTT